MEAAPTSRPLMVQRPASGVNTQQPGGMANALTLAMCSVRSMSVASISSEGSTESHGVEQEEITALTHDVRNFKEALGHLRRLFQPDRDMQEAPRVAAHERLGEVLRILRTVLEKHPALQYAELLMAAGTLIQHVKGYNYEDEKSNPKEFFDSIDQLALSFSSRVSDYLMGELDASVSLSSSVSSKTKSYETLAHRASSARGWVRGTGGGAALGDDVQSEQPELELLRTEQSVEATLRRTKHCSKYLKDVTTYAEKKAHLDLEYAKNLSKIALTVKPLVSEESHLPLQSTYCAALDHDIDNCTSIQNTNALVLGTKYLEPLNALRTEHERRRKQLKEQWQRELKRMQDAEATKRKTYALFVQRQQAARVATTALEDTSKPERRRKAEDEAVQKALEAENSYKVACIDVDERAIQLQRVKAEILHSLQALLLQYDQTLKAATMNLFQLQHSMTASAPVQFQTLYENSYQYEPGSQYHEFVKRFCALASQKHSLEVSSSFSNVMDKDAKALDSLNLDHDFSLNPQGPDGKGFSKKAWSSTSQAALGSDTDSSHSTKSREPSPTNVLVPTSRAAASSGDELEHKPEELVPSQIAGMSKASVSHKFRSIMVTNIRCPECDTKIYLHALECTECSLICHKECTKTLTIQCGPTRLPEKLSVFGVDLAQHLAETGSVVPHILIKCIKEIDDSGLTTKGIYRISGVKSKVEKLCQDFETGADRVDLSGMNAHVISSVLKLYLRQLPEPLLTFKLYPNFVRLAREWVASENIDVPADIHELEELVLSLPSHNFNSLSVLMKHLQRVASHAEVNSMPPSNLGIVFGPTLLRTPEGSASYNCLVDTVHQTRAIELLITHTKHLFNCPASNAPTNSTLQGTITTATETSQQAHVEMILPGFIAEHTSQPTIIKDVSATDCEFSANQDDAILGFTSDDDLPECLLPDSSPAVPTSPLLLRSCSHSKDEPILFRGSLKDYRGLEGAASLTLNTPEMTDVPHLKLKKSKSDVNTSKKIQHKVDADERGTKVTTFSSSSSMMRVENAENLIGAESQLISSLGGPSKKKDGKQMVRDASGASSSLDESFSEGERDEPGVALRRAATLPPSHSRGGINIPVVEAKEVSKGTPPSASNIMMSTKHHFSVVTNHFVGRRSSSVRAESMSSHRSDTSISHHTAQANATQNSSSASSSKQKKHVIEQTAQKDGSLSQSRTK